jgi:chemotaxis protein methyltransferase CheR
MVDKLSIVEYRDIITAINKFCGIDFSDYALTSLKRRFEKVLVLYNFKEVTDFIIRLETDKILLESVLFDISVEETEMFRDPPMWQDLKDVILTKFEHEPEYKIWLPECTSGDELFSLLILLKELKLIDKAIIYATSMCSKNLEVIKTGNIDLKKLESNTANFRRMRGDNQLSNYVDVQEKRASVDLSLFKNVTFIKHDLLKDKSPGNFKIILFRNKMLYYNQQLQSKAIEIIHNSLLPGGYLIIGVNESMEGSGMHDKFILTNPTENIFKKGVS